jgi:2-dehydro-3-deoxyphosphogluconate aldolase/(4S)-4-hydroxy-2-oxoglutarate aldolase
MRDRASVMAQIESVGVVAVVRAGADSSLVDVARALSGGGVSACEITMTTPGALAGITVVAHELADQTLVGVGSVLDAETARMAILAGAQFVVSPTFDPRVIEMAHRYGCPIIAGAMTPTEILAAWSAGADAVKVFPANHFGPQYFRDLHGPMPQLKLTPTGGVDLTTVADWISAGAFAVGVSSALVRKDLLAAQNWKGLTALAAEYVSTVQTARGI